MFKPWPQSPKPAYGSRIVTVRRAAVWALPLALCAAVPARAGDPDDGGFLVAQLFRQRVVMRVQTLTVMPLKTVWKEKKGPRCIAAGEIQAAGVIAPNSVDFILRGGQRVRARFAKSCPALAYYSGFYVAPNADGRICADRDAVRDRAGGECEIERVRTLVAAK
jgi:hypothetical protein